MKAGFFSLLLLISLHTRAQWGCTDPQALNYNAAAVFNDGSCLYGTTNYSLAVKDTLPPALTEISGMVYWGGKLYVHNDSGNPSILYETDTVSGNITKEIYFDGVPHTDWEDITQDDQYFYIGDIGNNGGNRTNLSIIKCAKNLIGAAYYDTITLNEVEIIHFTYADQTDFTYNLNNTAFDCEALAFKNNQLHLFTKNWTLGACVHYVLPAAAGTYQAIRIDSLNTGGTLVTGADFASNQQLMLIGYKSTGTAECALWYIYDFGQTDSFFTYGNKRKIGIGDALLLGQVESICFADSSGGFAGNERFNPIAPVDISQKLYRFNTETWYPYATNTSTEQAQSFVSDMIVVPSSQSISIKFYLLRSDVVHISIFTNKGKKVREKSFQLNSGLQQITIENLALSNGMYYVLLQNSKGEKKISKIFFPNR